MIKIDLFLYINITLFENKSNFENILNRYVSMTYHVGNIDTICYPEISY